MPKDTGDAAAAKAEKAVREAEKALTRVQADLNKAIMLVKQDKFTEKRAKAIVAKTLAVMSKHKKVTKLQTEKGFKDYPQEIQDQVLWIDELMNDLLAHTEQLPRMVKLMKKSPEKDIKVLSKQSKVLALEVKQPPKHVGVLVKEVKKGLDAGGPNGALIALLPMIMLLWLICDTIVRGLRKRP
ncbi:MAG: hypothetical protein AAGG09_19285 [Pseudomonadota bacterium]